MTNETLWNVLSLHISIDFFLIEDERGMQCGA